MIKLPPIMDYREAEKHVISPKNKEWFAQGANWMRAEVQRLNATAQPVSDGWIRCTDILPDAEGKYLVYETLNNRVNHDYWMEPEPAEGFWNHYDMNVTHWMPLPAAPGGQDD